MEYEIWAKSIKNVDDQAVTLSEHTNDVLRAFRVIKPKLKNEKLAKLIELVIKLHDFGKVLPSFQLKSLSNKNYRPFDLYTDLPHSIFSTLLINPKKFNELVYSIVEDDSYVNIAYAAIAYHHWRENFYDLLEGVTDKFDNLDEFLTSEDGKVIMDNLRKFVQAIELPADICGPNDKWIYGLRNGKRFADYVIPPYQLYRLPQRIELDNPKLKDWVLISGFTMIADHFASFKETDDNDVGIKEIEIPAPEPDTTKRAIYNQLKEKIEQSDKQFYPDDIWQFNEVEEHTKDNCVLVAPTGMGKTEFAYLWSDGNKFFYTLPLRAAVNQIFERTKSVFSKDHAGLLHSDADVFLYANDERQDSNKIYDLARQLSHSAIVSTGDQFFPYALRPPGFEKIFARFSYSRLIIDEVQAYDPKAAAIIVKFMGHVTDMGGKFLLMTATLPGFIKKKIVKYLPAEEPLDIYSKYKNQFEKFQKHFIQVKTINNEEKEFSIPDEYICEIITKARMDNGKRVLVILNTIKQAQHVFNAIERLSKFDGENLRILHSRFTYNRRAGIERKLKEWFGNPKLTNEAEPKILVATQVVEASLDLDADFMFSEIAPMDSLIQRMGRVLRRHRFDDETLFEVTEPNIFLWVFKKGYQSGRNKVYQDELIENTCNLISNKEISIVQLKQWHTDNSKDDLIGKIDNKTIKVSEFDKKELVEKLYDGLPEDSKYLSEFNKMMDLLDAGFMSDRKIEAQQTFREINNVQVIPKNLKDEFLKSVSEFDFEKNKLYTRFKNEIINQYVINVPLYIAQEMMYESFLAHNVFKREIEHEISSKNTTRLKYWLSGIYVIDIEYSDKDGNNLTWTSQSQTGNL